MANMAEKLVDKKYYRPTEVENLKGDSSLAKRILGWKPKISFQSMVKEMIEEDLYLSKLNQTLFSISTNNDLYVLEPIPEIGIDVPLTISRKLVLGKDPLTGISIFDYKKLDSEAILLHYSGNSKPWTIQGG